MNQKLRGKLVALFNIIIIPLIFTSIFSLIFINVLDIPVWKNFKNWGNNIPIVKYVIPGSVSQQIKRTSEQDNNVQESLVIKEELTEKKKKIAELNKQISSNQKTMENLKKTNEELRKRLEVKQSKEFEKQMKKVAEIYANIPISKAAAMLETMPIEEASITISMLQQKQQSGILGSMKDPKKAAQITMVLKEIAVLNETDQEALHTQIQEIVQKHENPTKILAETISAMGPVQSAGIIQSMMAVNSQVAIGIINYLGTDRRTQILTEIEKADAELAAQITTNINMR